jgi:hypothetical protein
MYELTPPKADAPRVQKITKIRKYILQISLVIIMLLITLGVFEGVLRYKNRNVNPQFSFTHENGLKTNKPNLNETIPRLHGPDAHIRTNYEGFPSDEHSIEAAPDTFRMAVMGNSFAEGFDVVYEKKMTSLMKELLPETYDGRHIEIMNFAVGGYSIAEQLLMYREFVQKYNPDLVVLSSYVGWDFSTNVRFVPKRKLILEGKFEDITPETMLEARKEFDDTQRNLKTKLVEELQILRHAITVIRENDTLYEIAIRLGLLNRPFTEEAADYLVSVWGYMDPDSGEHMEIMEFTADVIARLAELVEADGAKFAFTLIPSYWQIHDTYIDELKTRAIPLDLRLPNRVIVKRNQGKFPILDYSDRFSQAINEENIPVFVNDIGHFTEEGNRLAAEETVRFLRENAEELGL